MFFSTCAFRKAVFFRGWDVLLKAARVNSCSQEPWGPGSRYCTCHAGKKNDTINGCYFKRGDSGFCFCNSVATIVTVRCLGLINSFCFVSARHALLLDTASVVFHFKIGICEALMSLMYQTAIKIRVVFNCRALICFLGSVVSSCVILL